MEMTQKQIEIEAQNYLNGLDLPENADKQLILDNFKNGMTWMLMLLKEDKQQWIEKACKTISDKVENYINFYGDNDYCFDKQRFMKQFKQAMKGEI